MVASLESIQENPHDEETRPVNDGRLVSKEDDFAGQAMDESGDANGKVAWTVAMLVILVYGYMLLDFLLSEVKGLVFGFVVFICAAAWLSFIAYLVKHSGAFSSFFHTSPHSRGFSSLASN